MVSTGESKQEKFPVENLSSIFDRFDWLRSWIEVPDWLMAQSFNFFEGFLN